MLCPAISLSRCCVIADVKRKRVVVVVVVVVPFSLLCVIYIVRLGGSVFTVGRAFSDFLFSSSFLAECRRRRRLLLLLGH